MSYKPASGRKRPTRGPFPLVVVSDDTAGVISRYLTDCERRGLRPATLKRYRYHLTNFGRWLHPAELVDGTTDDLRTFLDSRPMIPRTTYVWLSILHNFYEWAVLEGLAEDDPTLRIRRPRSPRSVARPIADDDLADALKAADPQIAAMLTLAAFQGLRCGEIANLQREDILEGNDPPVLIVTEGKGGHQRVLPLHPATMPALHRAEVARAGYLFRRPNGARFLPWHVSHDVNTYLADMGIPATAHQLRHWFGTKTYAACRDIRVVQELMGHSNPVTTMMYTAWSTGTGREAVLALEVAR